MAPILFWIIIFWCTSYLSYNQPHQLLSPHPLHKDFPPWISFLFSENKVCHGFMFNSRGMHSYNTILWIILSKKKSLMKKFDKRKNRLIVTNKEWFNSEQNALAPGHKTYYTSLWFSRENGIPKSSCKILMY